ncbi:MAG: A24 family peptidase [candidate division WOR-3 bacterium]
MTWYLLKALVFISLLIVLAFIDLDLQILPFQITFPGLGLGLVASFFLDRNFFEGLVGAVSGATFIGLAWALWRFVLASPFRRHLGVNQKEGMGVGDLPMAAMIGAFVGVRGIAVALFASVVLGVVIGLGARALGRSSRGQPIPYGPFLAIGGLIGLFFGHELVGWYLRTMFRY